MNTKVEEALKVLDEQHDDYLQAGEYSGEGCWFGHNFAADYAKEYAAARATIAAHIAQQTTQLAERDATIARLEKKLIRYEVNNNVMARAALNQEQVK